ncbi:MAG: 3-methylitaconate isomerase [Acidaminococcales bacterium]|nr:3-methylitaconate isomerase [Acidaminococcales bacterium]
MYQDMEMLRCALVRGGTSKGVFIKKNELPQDPAKRDAVIRAIFGSPDVRQIDGLGGADVLTSKLAIISPSTREGADVDYTFGQVSFDTDAVDYGGNCGNISSAVGPFAIDEGMVAPVEPITTVRIHLTNSDNILVAEVPVKGGKAMVEGDFAIDGVPGTGAKITLDWADTAGAFTGKLLPTGHAQDVFHIDGKQYAVSIVDAGTTTVFVEAGSLGLKGTESPQEIEGNKPLMAAIERIRAEAALRVGFIGKLEDSVAQSPYNPFVAIVSPGADYMSISGRAVKASEVDLVARLVFMQRMHKTYPVTGTVCTGAAARVPGSIAWQVLADGAKGRVTVNIGHPGGVIAVESDADISGGQPRMKRIGVYRTARRIMDGIVYVKKSVYK